LTITENLQSKRGKHQRKHQKNGKRKIDWEFFSKEAFAKTHHEREMSDNSVRIKIIASGIWTEGI